MMMMTQKRPLQTLEMQELLLCYVGGFHGFENKTYNFYEDDCHTAVFNKSSMNTYDDVCLQYLAYEVGDERPDSCPGPR